MYDVCCYKVATSSSSSSFFNLVLYPTVFQPFMSWHIGKKNGINWRVFGDAFMRLGFTKE